MNTLVYGYLHIRDVDALRYPIKKNTLGNYYITHNNNNNITLNIPQKYISNVYEIKIVLYKNLTLDEFKNDTDTENSPEYLYINDDKVKNTDIVYYKSFIKVEL
jgi:hypothetical protein